MNENPPPRKVEHTAGSHFLPGDVLGYGPGRTMAAWAFEIRAHERAMTRSAGLTMGCLGAATAVVASAADALFLAHVGAAQFGLALALSSVLLVAVLSWVGARADTAAGGARGRLLQRACALAALAALGLSALVGLDATVGAWLVLLCGKQLTSSVDLLFWVLAADRLDARQNRRLVPIFVTAHGLGTVVGAFAVGPLAHALGSRATLAVGGLLFALAAVACGRFARHRGAHAVALATGRRASGQRSSLAIVRGSRLTRQLAVVVATAGVFAPLLYVFMGTSAQAAFTDDAALTAFFGQYRGAVQLLTFAAQLLIAPRVLAPRRGRVQSAARAARRARGLLVAGRGATAGAGRGRPGAGQAARRRGPDPNRKAWPRIYCRDTCADGSPGFSTGSPSARARSSAGPARRS